MKSISPLCFQDSKRYGPLDTNVSALAASFHEPLHLFDSLDNSYEKLVILRNTLLDSLR